MSLSTDTTTTRLEKLGLGKAAKEVEAKQRLMSKLEVAYKHYRYVTQLKIGEFNDQLMEKTGKPAHSNSSGTWTKRQNISHYGGTYDKLMFTALTEYTKVPPTDVLDKLEAAQELRCFDTFEVAQIQSIEVRPDPILFGRVIGCEDRFYVGQWDNDVKIEDILQADEGYVKEGFGD